MVLTMTDMWWHKLKTEVVDTNLETQCGTAVGVSNGTLQYEEINGIPVLARTEKLSPVPQVAYDACPGRYCNYPELNEYTFGKQPDSYLSGVIEKAYTGHATDKVVRRNGASGGAISQVLIYLLETKKITGAVCLKMGVEVPWRAKPIIARTKRDILDCAQSIYSVTPVNTILEELVHEEGPLAYVGLPDQVAGIRKLQKLEHPSVQNIEYVLGPYQGTQMYFEAIRSFLRSHGVQSEEEIAELKYRAGEWPGYLQIVLNDGRVLKAEKFYYNYLIPFFVSNSSLQLCDFTNELTDISVGDAWSPEFEQDRKGHSVILARTPKAVDLLKSMQRQNLLHLESIELTKALDMHGHMLDLKKRGSYIRNNWNRVQPDYGYIPIKIPPSRIAVEWCLRLFFGVGKLSIARWAVEHLPMRIVGPCFNWLRKTWKGASKTTKRKGLREVEFVVTR